MKIEISIYFVTSVFSFNLKIVATILLHKSESKKLDIDAFDLQEIKYIGATFLCYDIFYFLILAGNIIIYFFSSL